MLKIDGFTWREAVDDLRKVMEKVPADKLQLVIKALNEGKVNGYLQNSWEGEGCACFVGIVADGLRQEMLPVSGNELDAFVGDSFDIFGSVYGEVDTYSPFQQWLRNVQPNQTPANNKVAKMFADELHKMIAERSEE